MNAVFSGRNRIGVLFEQNKHYLVSIDDDNAIRECSQTEAALLLRNATDQDYVSNVAISDAPLILRRAADLAEALDLTLFLLDSKLSGPTRSLVALELNELLSDPEVDRGLLGTMFAQPLPPIVNLDESLTFAHDAPRTRSVLISLRESQESIALTRNSWNNLSVSRFLRGSTKVELEGLIIRKAVFWQIAVARTQGTPPGDVLAAVGQSLDVVRLFPTWPQILGAWLREIPWQMKVRRQTTADLVPDIEDDEEEIDQTPTHRFIPSLFQEHEAVLGEVDAIVRLVNINSDTKARQRIEFLIDRQLSGRDGKTHVVKSLCNIATKTRDIHRNDFAVELLNQALEIDADDPIALNLLGTEFKLSGRFDEALKAYGLALQATSPSDVAMIDRLSSAMAHILVRQEKFEEAIERYQAIPLHHTKPTILLAIADANRKAGRLSVAMAMYEKLIATGSSMDREFRRDRAFAGKAEIAKRRAKPHKAIQIYNDLLSNDKWNIDDRSRSIYQLALCQLLKNVGQLGKALEIAKSLVRSERNNLGAHFQIASIEAILKRNFAVPVISERTRETSRQAWKIEMMEGLQRNKRDFFKEFQKRLEDALDKACIALEERPIASCVIAFFHLAKGDGNAAKKILQSNPAGDTKTKLLQSVFVFHADSLIELNARMPSRSRRSSQGQRRALTLLQHREFNDALEMEVDLLLQAA